jgi:hypothetical protein
MTYLVNIKGDRSTSLIRTAFEGAKEVARIFASQKNEQYEIWRQSESGVVDEDVLVALVHPSGHIESCTDHHYA